MPPVRGEVARLEMAAAADREAQPIDRGAGGRRGLGAADLADLAADAKAIEVLAARLEAVGLDAHAVPELGPRDCRPFRAIDGKRAIAARSPSRPRRWPSACRRRRAARAPAASTARRCPATARRRRRREETDRCGRAAARTRASRRAAARPPRAPSFQAMLSSSRRVRPLERAIVEANRVSHEGRMSSTCTSWQPLVRFSDRNNPVLPPVTTSRSPSPSISSTTICSPPPARPP